MLNSTTACTATDNGVDTIVQRGVSMIPASTRDINTSQGSQFTSQACTGLLKRNGMQISMDGKDAWRDTVFVERLWRTVKYEKMYLHAYETIPMARAGLDRYIRFDNNRRPHARLGGATPDQVYSTEWSVPMAA